VATRFWYTTPPCIDTLITTQADESKASAEAAKVKAIKDECEADLAEALPALNAAIKVGFCF
jgi:hypothetical protein